MPPSMERSELCVTIHCELFRVDGDSYYMMLRDDTELRIRTDKTTVMSGDIKKGDLIEAKINDQNHALSIRSTKRK
jgi:hypothetical protein